MKGLYEKRGWWYYAPPKLPGQPKPKAVALRTQDEVEAVNRVAILRLQADEVSVVLSGTVGEILPSYYAQKGSDTKATRQARVVILSGFQEILGNPKVADLDADQIGRWLSHLTEKGGKVGQEKGLGAASRTSYLITVRAFLNWCRRRGILHRDPAAEFKKMVRVRVTRQERFLTVDERERVLAVDSAPDYVRLILHLGFFAGLRYGEMLAFRQEWLYFSPDGKRGTLTVQATPIEFEDGKKGVWVPKGKRSRVIPLHPRLLAVIREYGLRAPFMLAPEKKVWPADNKSSNRFDPKKSIHAVAIEAKVAQFTYHTLRHSFATHLAQRGRRMKEIADLLGNDVTVTERHYVGFSPDGDDSLGDL